MDDDMDTTNHMHATPLYRPRGFDTPQMTEREIILDLTIQALLEVKSGLSSTPFRSEFNPDTSIDSQIQTLFRIAYKLHRTVNELADGWNGNGNGAAKRKHDGEEDDVYLYREALAKKRRSGQPLLDDEPQFHFSQFTKREEGYDDHEDDEEDEEDDSDHDRPDLDEDNMSDAEDKEDSPSPSRHVDRYPTYSFENEEDSPSPRGHAGRLPTYNSENEDEDEGSDSGIDSGNADSAGNDDDDEDEEDSNSGDNSDSESDSARIVLYGRIPRPRPVTCPISLKEYYSHQGQRQWCRFCAKKEGANRAIREFIVGKERGAIVRVCESIVEVEGGAACEDTTREMSTLKAPVEMSGSLLKMVGEMLAEEISPLSLGAKQEEAMFRDVDSEDAIERRQWG
ncbi:hypothetical protein G7Y89_g13568 [Cudoniella acicularis]|uniref:Uncharacterized protein n=1 Tax=Cudoniella acicularis TaxID=354080 RepID=A0A8H4R8A6_9HELO|nr:hypothetical protein G7Y89_g13568 [Cudoniella acicularis]